MMISLIFKLTSNLICINLSLGIFAGAWAHEVEMGPMDYRGHQVISIYPESENNLQSLKELHKRSDPNVQFWSKPTTTKKAVHVIVKPGKMEDIHLLLGDDAKYHVEIPDLQDAIETLMTNNNNTGDSFIFNHSKYHDLEEIYRWLREMQLDHRRILTLNTIGHSHEGRPLIVAKISSSRHSDFKKPAVWMDALIHSNEWITTATLLVVLQKIVEGYGNVAETTWLVDNLDWYILPVFNPDGYVHTWNHDRLWRKNRALVNDSKCIGVDLNRNWPLHWGENSINQDPCGRMYSGPESSSEPEVQAVINFLNDHRNELQAYLAFHSFSQLWMTPYSYSKKENPSNLDELMRLSEAITKAMTRVNGMNYEYGKISDLLGTASGSSVDFTTDVLGIPYSFGVELRDTGRFGMLLPQEEIIPTGEETFSAIKVLGMHIIDKLFYSSN